MWSDDPRALAFVWGFARGVLEGMLAVAAAIALGAILSASGCTIQRLVLYDTETCPSPVPLAARPLGRTP